MQCLQWDWIPGPITLLATALPAELMEISTNTVSRGDYEPITVPIILVQQNPGADPGFQVSGAHLKKIAPSGGRRENFWGNSCEKSRFYAKKSYIFQF